MTRSKPLSQGVTITAETPMGVWRISRTWGAPTSFWHTGNNPKLFRDPTGNRRFIPMPISGEINEKLLRKVRDQIWAEAVELERVGRLAYYEQMRQEGVPVEEGDEKFPDIMLDPKFYNDAALLQTDARVENEYQEMVADVIFQSFVHFEEGTVVRDGRTTISSATVYVLSEGVGLHLGISPGQWNRASQKVGVSALRPIEG
jgi:hypothetical protein